MTISKKHRRRRRKHSHGKRNTVPIDRLTDLPDSVICHILSFLSTQESVATSILSRRWRYLWSYVPNLFFRNENQGTIDRVISLHKLQTINSFSIRKDDWENDQLDSLDSFAAFAVGRNVRKIDLYFYCEEPLPRCLFTCKTLVFLSLNCCGLVVVSSVACLPRLKILRLMNLDYEADECIPNLISGCPVLEELTIKSDGDMDYCNVSSPTIKKLFLDFMNDGYHGGRANMLEINIPSLEYLKIHDSFTENIKCGVLTSLTEANIILYRDDTKEDHYLCSRSLLEFLDNFCKVRCLELNLAYCTKIIDSVLSTWTTKFHNLTKLELTTDCRFLPQFLENADNLEILIFSESNEEMRDWKEPPQQVPTCVLSHLRIIKLVWICGNEQELEIIKYLLRNAKVLEMMEITYSQFLDSDKIINMLTNISRFQRGSAACEVAFFPA
ncbi:hypothetical protein ABFS83_13G052200 [Erythranthe nasuta]